MKRALNSEYYLLRGVEKTTGETALFCFAHNLTRSLNLLGFKRLMAAVSRPFLLTCGFEGPILRIRFAF